MATRKTSVEINEELLRLAQGILATKTVRETVDQAFREVVRGQARREEVEALAAMREMDLDKPEIMARAWRK